MSQQSIFMKIYEFSYPEPILKNFCICYTNLMQIILLGSVENFIASLNNQEIAKSLHVIELLEEFGNRLGMPHSKHLDDSMFELRIRGKREIRIFYCFHKNKVIMLHAFIKKTKTTPSKELLKAKAAKKRFV